MVSRAVSIVYRLQLRINLSLSVVNWFRSLIALLLGIVSYRLLTARCYAERGYEIACRLSVRPSVTLMYVFHTGWNSSKIILGPNSLRPVHSIGDR